MDEDFCARVSGETEARISHFIPSVELKGSRYEKLQKLDTLIVYLEQLRRSLAGETTASGGRYEGLSRRVETSASPWVRAGALLGVLFLLLVAARSCA